MKDHMMICHTCCIVEFALVFSKMLKIKILTKVGVPSASKDFQDKLSSDSAVVLPTATTGTASPWSRIGMAHRFQFALLSIG